MVLLIVSESKKQIENAAPLEPLDLPGANPQPPVESHAPDIKPISKAAGGAKAALAATKFA